MYSDRPKLQTDSNSQSKRDTPKQTFDERYDHYTRYLHLTNPFSDQQPSTSTSHAHLEQSTTNESKKVDEGINYKGKGRLLNTPAESSKTAQTRRGHTPAQRLIDSDQQQASADQTDMSSSSSNKGKAPDAAEHTHPEELKNPDQSESSNERSLKGKESTRSLKGKESTRSLNKKISENFRSVSKKSGMTLREAFTSITDSLPKKERPSDDEILLLSNSPVSEINTGEKHELLNKLKKDYKKKEQETTDLSETYTELHKTLEKLLQKTKLNVEEIRTKRQYHDNPTQAYNTCNDIITAAQREIGHQFLNRGQNAALLHASAFPGIPTDVKRAYKAMGHDTNKMHPDSKKRENCFRFFEKSKETASRLKNSFSELIGKIDRELELVSELQKNIDSFSEYDRYDEFGRRTSDINNKFNMIKEELNALKKKSQSVI